MSFMHPGETIFLLQAPNLVPVPNMRYLIVPGANHMVPGANHLVPLCHYPMTAYFPPELTAAISNTDDTAAQAAAAFPDATTITSGADADPPANGDDNNSTAGDAQQLTETKYKVIHKIELTPWAPVPGDTRTDSRIVGTYTSLQQANKAAMQEVYELFGGMAHSEWRVGPDPNWIRRKDPGVQFPNTWEVEDGCLKFSVINSQLRFTLKGEVSVVKV